LSRIAIDCAAAVFVLESSGILHRDIAARNFLLTDALKVKLSDFGMSKFSGGSAYYSQKDIAVPVRWAAPEVVLREKFSPASDRYSLGVTLYEVFSKGMVPFTGYGNHDLINKMKAGQYLRLEKPEFASDAQYAIIMKLTAEDAESRPADVVSLLREADPVEYKLKHGEMPKGLSTSDTDYVSIESAVATKSKSQAQLIPDDPVKALNASGGEEYITSAKAVATSSMKGQPPAESVAKSDYEKLPATDPQFHQYTGMPKPANDYQQVSKETATQIKPLASDYLDRPRKL